MSKSTVGCLNGLSLPLSTMYTIASKLNRNQKSLQLKGTGKG